MPWRREPLCYVVYNLIMTSRSKTIKEEDLYSMLKHIYPDVSPNDLTKALMTLELRGLITVSQIKDNVRIVKIPARMAGYR